MKQNAPVGLVWQHWSLGQEVTQAPPPAGQHWPVGHLVTHVPFEQQKPARQAETQRVLFSQHCPLGQGTLALQATQTCRLVSQRRPWLQSLSASQPQLRLARQTCPSWLWVQLKQAPPEPQRSLAVPAEQMPRLEQQPASGQRAVSMQVG